MLVRKIETVELSGVTSEDRGGGIHPYHEILFISEGEIALQWMGRDYAAASPALFLLPPNTPHLLVRQSAACRFGYIELDIQDAADFPDLARAGVWNDMQTAARQPELAAIYETAAGMWDSLRPQSPYRSIAAELVLLDIRKLLLLIGCCLLSPAPRTARTADAPAAPEQAATAARIQEVMRYMESNYPYPMTVAVLAARAHLEVTYFIRSFHKMAGTTPLQYLHDLRLNAAACFLTTTDRRIQDITGAVGFHSIHYFSRLFKQRYGESPSAWRYRHKSALL